MRDLITSRAHRILKKITNYIPLLDENRNPPYYTRDVSSRNDELLIGVYENIPTDPDESIIISDIGLYISQVGAWRFVDYRDIARLEISQDKERVEGFNIHLTSGEIVWLPVKGKHGKLRDAFEFLRFLDRVIDDVRSG